MKTSTTFAACLTTLVCCCATQSHASVDVSVSLEDKGLLSRVEHREPIEAFLTTAVRQDLDTHAPWIHLCREAPQLKISIREVAGVTFFEFVIETDGNPSRPRIEKLYRSEERLAANNAQDSGKAFLAIYDYLHALFVNESRIVDLLGDDLVLSHEFLLVSTPANAPGENARWQLGVPFSWYEFGKPRNWAIEARYGDNRYLIKNAARPEKLNGEFWEMERKKAFAAGLAAPLTDPATSSPQATAGILALEALAAQLAELGSSDDSAAGTDDDGRTNYRHDFTPDDPAAAIFRKPAAKIRDLLRAMDAEVTAFERPASTEPPRTLTRTVAMDFAAMLIPSGFDGDSWRQELRPYQGRNRKTINYYRLHRSRLKDSQFLSDHDVILWKMQLGRRTAARFWLNSSVRVKHYQRTELEPEATTRPTASGIRSPARRDNTTDNKPGTVSQ